MISKKKLSILKRVESICDSFGYDYSFDGVYFLVHPRKVESPVYFSTISSVLIYDLNSLPDVCFVSVTRLVGSDDFYALFLVC